MDEGPKPVQDTMTMRAKTDKEDIIQHYGPYFLHLELLLNPEIALRWNYLS